MHPAVRWLGRRRPLLTAIVVLLPTVLILVGARQPVDLLDPRLSISFLGIWALLLLGVAVRVWGSGNLRKNQEITSVGIYRMVRHPLYTGSLAILLAYLLAAGGLLLGLVLFAFLCCVFLAAIRNEEEWLARAFPEQVAPYRERPRLLPDLRRLPDALRTDRFRWSMAYRNLGLRSIWMVLLVPVVLELLDRVAAGS